MRTILEAKNLCVKRGEKVVVHIPAFSLHEGGFISIIGPNGAGKSSFLLALAALIPFSGSVFFRGEEVHSRDEVFYRRKISMVFQDPLLLDTTVFHNVAMGLKLRGLKRVEIKERARWAMEKLGIAHLEKRRARMLSGGEAQRVSLARALAVRPQILLLDEPFSSLDPPTREELRYDLKKILLEMKTAAIMTTHDRDEALMLSDYVAVMKDGKIVQMGAALEVMNRPIDEFVASFVGVETILRGTVISSEEGMLKINTSEGGVISAVGDLAVGEKVLCCIRPEHVTIISDGGQEKTSARNLMPGTITEISHLGFFSRISIDCGFPMKSYVSAPSVREMSLETGKRVLASFKATSVHVIKDSNVT